MRSYKVADMLRDFENKYGSALETALHAMARDMHDQAAKAGPLDFSAVFTEAGERYEAALAAWRELADAIDPGEEHFGTGGTACACGEVFASATLLGTHIARKRARS